MLILYVDSIGVIRPYYEVRPVVGPLVSRVGEKLIMTLSTPTNEIPVHRNYNQLQISLIKENEMKNLPKTLDMMIERGLDVCSVAADKGKVTVSWADAPTDAQKDIARMCCFDAVVIHSYK